MHKLLGGLCAALLFLAGLPQIGHTAEPVPLKTAWLGEHEAFAAWYAKQKGWDLEEGFRLEMRSYDSGKQLMAGMNTAHWEIAACGAHKGQDPGSSESRKGHQPSEKAGAPRRP